MPIRSFCNDAGKLNCKKMNIIIASEGDEHGIMPEKVIVMVILEVGIEKLHLLHAGF